MRKPYSYFFIIILAIISFTVKAQQRKQVLLDSYFNDEHMKDAAGQMISYHYKWNETDNNGFSIFKAAFKTAGATGITELHGRPNPDVLGSADVYIIVDPDTKKESPNPKYIKPDNVKVITDWVRKGGVLLLMANDSANVELPHFNTLAEKFGIHFNDDLRNHVKDDQHWQDGTFNITGDNPVLKTAHKIYMKDICSLTLTLPAYAVLKDGGANIISVSHYGKGWVI